MNKITIGINQRIPMSILEMALVAALQDQATNDYLRELVATEFNGENRIRLGAGVLLETFVRFITAWVQSIRHVADVKRCAVSLWS